MTRPGTIGWFARHELLLAWRDWAWLLSGGHSRHWLFGAVGVVAVVALMHALAWVILRAGGRADRAARPAHAGDDRRHALALRLADAVAGDRKRDPRLLRPRRPRPDPVVAGRREPAVRGADRRDDRVDYGDGARPGRPDHQCSGLVGRSEVARRIRRRGGSGDGRDGGVGGRDGAAVRRDRRAPDAGRGPDRRRRGRCQLCDLRAVFRDPLDRIAVAARVPDLRPRARSRAGGGQPRVAAGLGRCRRLAGPGDLYGDRGAVVGGRGAVLRAAVRHARPGHRRGVGRTGRGRAGMAGSGVGRFSVRDRRRRPCAARNGCCCAATPG